MACCKEELSTPLLPEEPPRGAVLTKILRSLRSISNCEDVNASQSSSPYTLIQKVPNILRCNKDLNKYLEPMVVSIGPHHYNKVKLQPGEKLKHKLMEKFFHNRDWSVLYQKILNKIKGLRKCYDEDTTENYNDETLAWMLFVDGSSVLFFIHCYVNDQYSLCRDLKIKHHEVVFMHRDLFLLENQLPFRVLKELMYSEIEYEVWKREIEAFIRMDIESPRRLQETRTIEGLEDTPDQADNQKPLLMKEPPHLLDLLREGLIRKPDQSNNPGTQATMNRDLSYRRHFRRTSTPTRQESMVLWSLLSANTTQRQIH
ncbi:hypothetical protein L1049_008067 [Liquidambar formosana]|uniref:Uncharacterized protein n=1 Tax=Liquidambar formosana TaxID=63359 RepID=A0AAP0S999_LIQFO